MYDADGSGELDKDEFIMFLQTAGEGLGCRVQAAGEGLRPLWGVWPLQGFRLSCTNVINMSLRLFRDLCEGA